MNKKIDSHLRTRIIKFNSIGSVVFRGIQVIINILLVRLLLNILGKYEYGLWVTMSSVLSWLSLANIGLGHGMRNKVAEAVALGQKKLAQTYISTTYALLGFMCIFLFIFIWTVDFFVNLNSFFNVTQKISSDMSSVFFIIGLSVIFQFLLGLLNSVFGALHKIALSNALAALGNILVLLILYWFYKYSNLSLFHVALIYSGVPLLILLIATIIFYSFKNYLRPKISSIDFSKSSILLTMGGKFFILQIAAVILFTTDNLIISKLFSPADVTPYNVVFKYFSIISVGFTAMAAPFWSGTTDAYVKKDYYWIKKSIKKLITFWLFGTLIVLLMVYFSPKVYNLWIGKGLQIPIALSVSFGVYVLVNSWNAIFSAIINGIGELNFSFKLAILGALINIPLSIYLSNIFGITGVVWATILCQLLASVLIPIQCYYLLKD